MASPIASGRMIRRSISESEKIAQLSPVAAVLFMMLIPHFNAHGKMPGGPGVVKDEVVPLIPYLSYENLPEYLQEISDKTNVKWFKEGSRWWLHALHFNTEHQELNKLGPDKLPGYTDHPPTSPELVPDSPSAGEGLKVGSKEERTKEKDSTTTTVLEESNGVGQQAEPEPLSSLVRMGLPEFREAFYQATGNLLPGGLNGSALVMCQHNPRDKLQQFFEIMAAQGGRTFKYFREIVDGKPKVNGVVERRTKGELRQEKAIANAQEALRRVQEAHGGKAEQADTDGYCETYGHAGGGGIDCGTAVVVSGGP